MLTAFAIDRDTGCLTLLNTGKAGGRNTAYARWLIHRKDS